MANNTIYFAADEAKKTAGALLEKAKSFYSSLEQNDYLEKLNKMYRYYHGMMNEVGSSGHQINFTGEQGELVSLPVNHFRNIGQHVYNMITANRPSMDARAVNTDYKSLAQTTVANGILDYYMREKHLEDSLRKAVEIAIVLGAGFVRLEWNATAGEVYDYDEESQHFNYEGDLEFSNLNPLDVVVDGTKESWNHEWMVVRTFMNRFNLMAKYPEHSEQIQGIPSKSESMRYRINRYSNDDTDDIPVYEFFHKRTEALPNGRYMLFLDSDTVLLDIHLPYRTIPIFRVSAGEMLGTPYGYSPLFDIFPIQEGINALYSSIMTNQNAHAVTNVFVKRGSDINVSTVDGAMNIIEGNEKPEVIEMLKTAPEVFKFLEMLIQAAETISGVNSVARGNPQASLESGTALALVQSMALQFMSGLQQSYVRLIEDVGTSVIQILKDFATTPRVIAIVGKNNRALLKEFTGEDISSINRVVVDMGNALSRSVAGRVQMAEQLLQMKLLKNPQQYFQIINTGRLDVMYEGDASELMLIKQENEKMMSGEEVIATALDAHRTHILEHKSVLADPDLRKDGALVQNTLAHIQQHINLLRTTDPDLLALLGEQPLTPIDQVPEMPYPSEQSAERSSMGGVMQQPEGGNSAPGQEIQSEALGQVSLPQVPTPPEPFAELPTNPQDVIPQ